MSLWLSLAAVGAILLVVSLAGALLTPALLPFGVVWRAERLGWSFALGGALISLATVLAVMLGLPPGWLWLLVATAVAAALAFALHLHERDFGASGEVVRLRAVGWIFGLFLVCGVLLYLLRALTEPMWSNDYLVIWGLKAKTLYFARAFPSRIWPKGLYAFAHLEYPLGLPLLYAGLAFLLGRWDDHASALLFPFWQAATLAVLWGWLRRRGAPWPVPIAAAALLSQFQPLYSAFLTGMGEVPLSFFFLLFGTALSDCLDKTDSGAGRRLATASALAAWTKNEGLFLVVAGGIGAMWSRSPDRRRIVVLALFPAAAIAALSRLLSGSHPSRDFDLTLVGPRVPELPSRLVEALRTELTEVILPAWPILLCLAALLAVGRRNPFADRLLFLVAACLAAYLLLPAFAVPGPSWLVRTTLSRTAAALAPMVAAGTAGRLTPGVKRET